jgi:hypothetical protein
MPERASHRHRPEHRSPAGPRNECDTSVRQAVDVSYLLRLVLPDRPGALGAVATALGTVGADILSVDVIERSPGSATDDFVVELPPDKLADSLVSAAATVPGVQVESIRPYAGQIDPHRELALLDSLGQSPESSLPPPRARCGPGVPRRLGARPRRSGRRPGQGDRPRRSCA